MPLAAAVEQADERRVDQHRLGTGPAPAGEGGEVLVAQPQVPGGTVRRGDLERGSERRGVLDVQREREVDADRPVEILERRDVVGECGPFHRGDGTPTEAPPDDPVVVEHGHAVGGHPDVALETGRTQTHGELEGRERVLPFVGPGAPVGEEHGGAVRVR